MEAEGHKASFARYIEQLVEDYQGQPLKYEQAKLMK